MGRIIQEHVKPPATATGSGIATVIAMPGMSGETRAIIVAALVGVFTMAEGISKRGVKGEVEFLRKRLAELNGK